MILLSELASPTCEEHWLSQCHQGISPENGAGSLVYPTRGEICGRSHCLLFADEERDGIGHVVSMLVRRTS